MVRHLSDDCGCGYDGALSTQGGRAQPFFGITTQLKPPVPLDMGGKVIGEEEESRFALPSTCSAPVLLSHETLNPKATVL